MKKYAMVMMLVGAGLISGSRAEEGLPIIFSTQIPELSTVDGFNYDGSEILVHDLSSTNLLDSKTGKFAKSFDGSVNLINSPVLSPDGSKLLTGGSNFSAILWDTKSLKILEKFPNLKSPTGNFRFSSDGSKIIIATRTGSIYVWDIKKYHELYRLEGMDSANDAGFSKTGDKIYSIQFGGETLIHDLLDENNDVAYEDAIDVVFNSNESRLILINIKQSRIINIETKKVISEIGNLITTPTFNKNESKIFVVTENKNKEKLLEIYDANSGKNMMRLTLTKDFVYTNKFSPNNSHLLMITKNGLIRIWDTESGNLISTTSSKLSDSEVFMNKPLAFSPNENILATIGPNDDTQIWNVANGKLITSLALLKTDFNSPKIAKPNQVKSIIFSSDGKKLLIVWSNNIMKLYDSSSLLPKK